MAIDEKKPSLRQRNHERIRQRILETALSLFTAHGFDQTTMDAIAEQAEVGRATLFKYFPTKSSLLLPLAQQILFAELRPQVQTLLEQQPTTIEALRYYFDLIGQRIEELSDLTRALIKAIGMVGEDAAEHVPDFAATLNSILRCGQERGDVRNDLSLEELTGFISTLYGTIVNQAVKSNQMESYTTRIEQFLAFVGTGLAG